MIAQDELNVEAGFAVGNSLNELLRIVGHDLFLPACHSAPPGVIGGNGFDRVARIELEQFLEMVYSKTQVEIRFKELFGLRRRQSQLRSCPSRGGREKL